MRETVTGWDSQNKINFYTDDPLVETAPWMAGKDVAIEGTTTVVGAPLHPVVDGGSLYMQGVAIVLEWVAGMSCPRRGSTASTAASSSAKPST